MLNDKAGEDSKHKTNLLESLNLPTKRPFKKMFMNEQEKKIHTMVQRLSYLGKQYDKDRKEKKETHKAAVQKRVKKENEKREKKQKELRKDRYKKGQSKKTRGQGRGDE